MPVLQYTQGVLASDGYGAIGITVVSIDHGIKLYSSQAKGRATKAMYSVATSAGTFSVSIMFVNHAAYERTMKWLEGWGRRFSDPNNTNIKPVRCMVPVRNFDKTGIPTGGITFGDEVGNITYPSTIEFVGASDISTNYSQFELSTASAEANAPYFYPGGNQLSGTQSAADDVIFSYDRSYEKYSDPGAAYQQIYNQLNGLPNKAPSPLDGDASSGVGR